MELKFEEREILYIYLFIYLFILIYGYFLKITIIILGGYTREGQPLYEGNHYTTGQPLYEGNHYTTGQPLYEGNRYTMTENFMLIPASTGGGWNKHPPTQGGPIPATSKFLGFLCFFNPIVIYPGHGAESGRQS